MGRFCRIIYVIVELPQISGGNSMKKLLVITLAVVLCLSAAACSTSVSAPEATQPSASHSHFPSEPLQTTPPTQAQPQQNMCYWCGEMPVGDFETYCVNCRCLKCGELRKDAGRYLYCRQHNCNEAGCEYPAFDDSQYCSEHKCSKPNCDNRRWSGSEYCASHK